jgi:anti-sigma regulatory factor (Ser/Thr protein kinase)
MTKEGSAISGSAGAVDGPSAEGPIGAPEHGSGIGTVPRRRPLVSGLELGALPTAVGCGRDHARRVLREWGLSQLADDAGLLVSELLTNALRATWTLDPPAPISLRLLADDQQLIIEAWDRCAEGPELRPRHSGDDEHGRGLVVVQALSRRWGVRRMSGDVKVVWCELGISARP